MARIDSILRDARVGLEPGDAELLLCHALGRPRSWLYAHGDDEPGAAAVAAFEALLARRRGGEPVAYITGRRGFWSLDLQVGPATLIPRAETELLARAAIALAQETGARLAIDVCTGCGNLALALAHAIDGLQVHGADLSADSVGLARRNAAMLGLEARACFREGDLLAPFDADGFAGQVDLLVCNPPYISSGKVQAMAAEISAHEPRLAFDGGPLGVSILTRLIHEAPRYLRTGGWLAFEVGAGQGSAMARRLRNHGAWAQVRELEDGHGLVRAVLARRGAETETTE